MKLLCSLLCDNVTVEPFTIHGVYDTRDTNFLEGRDVTCALVFQPDAADNGVQYSINLRIIDAEGSEIAALEAPFVMTAPGLPDFSGAQLTQCYTMSGISFPDYGLYHLEVYLGSDLIQSLPCRLRKAGSAS